MGSVFIVAGLAYGLAHAGEQVPVALTGFVLGTFLFQFLLAGAFAALSALFRNFPVLRRAAAIGVGSVAVAGMINAVVVSSEAAERLEGPDRVQLVPKLSQNVARSAPGVQVPRKLTDPYMIFLIVEAFETRIEVLASGKSVVNHLEFPLKSGGGIAIEEQDDLKNAPSAFWKRRSCCESTASPAYPTAAVRIFFPWE